MADCVVLLSIPGLRNSDLAHMPRLSGTHRSGRQGEPCAEFSRSHLAGAGQYAHRANGARSWRDRQRVLLARFRTKSRCGPPGTTKSSSRRFGIFCTSTIRRLRVQFGFRCSARAAARITSACRRRFIIPMGASRCGATPSRRPCMASSAMRSGIFR